MSELTTESGEPETIRAVILDFIQQRLQPKLDKLKEGEDEKRQKLMEAYAPEAWLADAARRVGQIQQVTHALKYINPDAKGTSLNAPGNPQASTLLIGTHTNPEKCPPDVVGNAAALDVYKFLRLEVGGKSLLALAASNDPSLQAALSDNGEQATAWMESFATLTQSKGSPTSHKLAKQVYWPIEEGGYHLLAPLFPTSLVHQVWRTIREARFSEEAKSAREARRKEEPHPHGFCEYPHLVIQQFGGTKPQNISQLNSERYGENYLLASCPPSWRSDPVKPPMKIQSIFDSWFENRPAVRRQLGVLRRYLIKAQPINNMYVREKRARLVAAICDELLLCASELQTLEESWSLHENCKLGAEEQYWLNPYRATVDESFSRGYSKGAWVDAVCERFSSWLNARLVDPKHPLPFGENEAREWRTLLDKEIAMIRTEMYHYD